MESNFEGVVQKWKDDKLKMWDYIDITTPMINAGYDKFYDEDPLHMNELGYSLLSKLVRDKIYN